jgi:pilus assembly protein Flp/PilA
MSTCLQLARSVVADRRGVTAMEYGLIAGILAVGLAAAFTALSDRLEAAFAALTF